MGRRSYKDETKAAVMAALLQGQSVSSVAKEYDIPKGTVSGWKQKAKKAAGDARKEGVANEATQKSGEVGELLIKYLQANLKALQAQAEQFSNEEWLREQDAAAAATLHGVMTDKAVRLIEAFGEAEE